MSDDKNSDGFVPTKFVCKGYEFKDGKTYVRLHQLTEDMQLAGGEDGGGLWDVSKKDGAPFRSLGCGSIYEIMTKHPTGSIGTILRMKATFWGYAGEFPALAPLVDAWQLQNKASQTLKTVAAQEKRAEELSGAMGSLDQIRKLYRATNFEGRLAIEVRLLTYLRRGIG